MTTRPPPRDPIDLSAPVFLILLFIFIMWGDIKKLIVLSYNCPPAVVESTK